MTPANGHLEANGAALRECCSDFFAWWRQSPEPAGESHLIFSLSGLPDLEIERPGGSTFILYNLENPLATAAAETAGETFPRGSLTLLFGLGLGYRTSHILRSMEEGHTLCIVERAPEILRWSLSLQDYSAEIRSGRLLFAVPEEEPLRRLVREKSGALLSGRIRLILEEYTRRLDGRAVRLHDACVRQANAIRINFNTAVQMGGTLILNELENLPKAILGWDPAGILAGGFRGRPAIIVATGPSLQKNVTLLREARGKALIIAVGQALRVLRAYDVRPDIVCSIDFGKPNHDTMADAIGDADMPLLAHPQVYPRVPFEYQGDLFVIQDRTSLLAPREGDEPAPLTQALTVAQTALNLAIAAGADPIVFTGQDLAYGESTHIDGAFGRQQVSVQGDRIVMKNDRTTRDGDVYWVPGYHGGRVPTSAGLLAFLEDIEEAIGRHPGRRFINATEGGARISGAEQISLREVLEMHCREEFPVPEILAAARMPLGVDPERLCRELDTAGRHLEHLLAHARKLARIVDGMKALLPGDVERERPGHSGRLGSLNRQALNSFDSILRSLEENPISRLATARLKHLLIRMDGKSAAAGDIRLVSGQTVRYCEELCSGLKDICTPLRAKIDTVHSVLSEYASAAAGLRAVGPDGAGGGQEASLRLRLGKCLRRMGHLGPAAAELERVARSESFRNDALEELVSLHLDRKRFAEAAHCIGNLPDGHPPRQVLGERLRREREQDRQGQLERARLFLEREDFAGSLLVCRALQSRHGDTPEGRALMDRSLELRERRIREAGLRVREDREKRQARTGRERRLQAARRKMEEKDYPAALALFRELAAADPADVDAMLGAARVCEGLKDWAEAERELRRVTACRPERGLSWRDLGNVLLRQGKIGEALDSYRRAVDGDPGSKGLCLEIALVLSSAGRPSDALSFCERHLKAHPNDYRSLVLWADCFLRLGSGAAARMGYEAALRIRPGFAPAVERLERIGRAVPA